MSVEASIHTVKKLRDSELSQYRGVYEVVLVALEAMRDLDEPNKLVTYGEAFPEPIPSGYWFLNTFWKPTFQSLVGAGEHIIEEYRKRKAAGNCFATEEEARERVGRLK